MPMREEFYADDFKASEYKQGLIYGTRLLEMFCDSTYMITNVCQGYSLQMFLKLQVILWSNGASFFCDTM